MSDINESINKIKRYAVTLQPATRLLIKSAATTALGFPTSDFLQTVIHNFNIASLLQQIKQSLSLLNNDK